MLEIKDLHGGAGGKIILRGVSLTLEPGKTYALMGPNGSGKSTLSNMLMGHPKYNVTKGSVRLDGRNLLEMPPDKRAKKGLFLSFQYPYEVPGITISNFLRIAYNETHAALGVPEFFSILKEKMTLLEIDESFSRRHVNVGFSGGEKKRMEMLQMAVLNPKYAILDEPDSGLDVDALRIVSDGLKKIRSKDMALLIITHYNRILQHIKPDILHIMVGGKIIKTGGYELAKEIERKGYR